MVSYTTYDFYTNEYFGDLLSESLFSKYVLIASNKLNYLCFGHITEEDIEKYSDEIQRATCALVEVLFKLDKAKEDAGKMQGGNIKSMSAGGQSVSFGNTETEITMAMNDEKKQYELFRNAIEQYLYKTDLLYAGV